MKPTYITIRYGDGFSDTAGSTTISLPTFIEQAPLPKVKGFFKLAAQNSYRADNAGEVLRLEAYLTRAIGEAEKDLERAKTMEAEPGLKKAEIACAQKWLTRLQKAREGFTAALDKHTPKTKKRK